MKSKYICVRLWGNKPMISESKRKVLSYIFAASKILSQCLSFILIVAGISDADILLRINTKKDRGSCLQL